MFERSAARLHRALRRVEQTVSDREGSDLVELDAVAVAIATSSVRPRRDDAEVAQDVLGVRPGAPRLARAQELALDELAVEVEEGEPVRLEPAFEDVARRAGASDAFVIARPPSPATTS